MKKLLSICFLSIVLGLLSFSVSAQNGECTSHSFWIENLKPATVTGVVNAPDGSGNVVLNNNMNIARKDSIDLYELHFCPCDLDPKTKISVDWLLYRDGQLVNDNLSNYAEFDIFTWYPELNQQGLCQSIHWLGGRVPDAFGCCNEPVQPDMFSGYQCNTPTNYPGALQVGHGTPGSVLNALGEQVPAQGNVSVYTEAFDFFYLDFFQHGRTVVQIKWKQVGNYSLVMRIRERKGGTDWYNLYWGGEENNHVGGHMSCCYNILAQDSITPPVNREFSKEVCSTDVPFTYGNPPYDFYVTTPDTNVLFGHYEGELECEHLVTDSIVRFHFFVRHNPVVQVDNHIDTICSCDTYTAELFGLSFDTIDLDVAIDSAFQWYHKYGSLEYAWQAEMHPWKTIKNETDTTYIYIVRQVNTYNNFGETVVCEGPGDTIYITINAIEAPELNDNFDICLEDVNASSTFTAVSDPDGRCANATHWYTKADYFTPDHYTAHLNKASMLEATTNSLEINLANYIPSTNKDTVVYFFATSFDTVTGCESKHYSWFTITFHQTPELARVTTPDSLNCPGSVVTMKVRISNNPNDTDNPYTYKWEGVSSINLDGTTVPFVGPQVTVVGTGTENGVYFPFNAANGYSYTQQIFTATEVGTGVISKIGFDLLSPSTYNAKTNVDVYMMNLADDEFASKTFFDATGAQLVYSGAFNLVQGWNDITLTNPYNFDGTANLLLIIDDHSGNGYGSAAFASTNTTEYRSLRLTNGSAIADPNAASLKNKRQYGEYRNNIRFTVESETPTTDATNQEAYFMIPDTAVCNQTFLSTVYVVDSNGCKSNVVPFNYGVGDTVAPAVNPANVTWVLNACDLDSTNTVAFKTVAELEQIAHVTVTDNCNKNLITLTYTDAKLDSVCEKTLVRTYTLTDICGNDTTFVHTFIAHDSTAPEFRHDSMASPLVKLLPVPGGNCTYNAPDSMTFVNAVRNMVYDECTDTTYLLSTLRFFWENTNISPINDTNIFRVDNHLTVTASIEDECGNAKKQVVIYFDQPDSLWIEADPEVLPRICENDTAHLYFDTVKVHGDLEIGPFLPYTYHWTEVNGREVIFVDANAKETDIIPVGSGDFIFKITVTDANGCEAESGLYFLHVNPIPNIDVREVTYDGSTRPYCPTYGWMTLAVFDATTGDRLSTQSYTFTWEGEGVNVPVINSDTTILNIVPDSCDHDYLSYVTVTDEIFCTAKDSVIVPVRDTEGPIILAGTLHDTILTPDAQCKLRVPNYRPLLNTENVTSKCGYPASKILETYVQIPEAGTVTELDTTEIKITLTTPCGTDSTYIVYAFKPDNYVTVKVTVEGDSICENDEEYIENGVILTANVQLGTGPYAYVWTKGLDTNTVLGNDPTLEIHDPSGVYTYHVAVLDANNCPASDEADVTIWAMPDVADTTTTPNWNCEDHNGTLTINEAPTGFMYNIQGQTKISDNHNHQLSEYSTVFFENLDPGNSTLTITNLEGCQREMRIHIDDRASSPDTVVATPHAVTNCRNNNGYITITREDNYTYFISTDGGVTYTMTELTVIPNLSSGTYYFKRMNNVTECWSSPVGVYIPNEAETLEFTHSSTVNTYCYPNQGDGTLTIGPAGLVFTVVRGNDTILNYGGAQTLTGLVSGRYQIFAFDTISGCVNSDFESVGTSTTNPSATVTTDPNRFCDENHANGKINVTPTSVSPAFTYTILHGGDTIQPADYNKLYEGDYDVELITAKGCTKHYDAHVGENKVDPELTITPKTNSTCIPEEFDGKLTITVNNATATGDIASYTITGDNAEEPITNTTGVFTGLASDRYHIEVVTEFGCVAEADTTVDQYHVPAMELDSTANYMCEPTATKPGNGTITIISPRNTNTKHYHYKYYDSFGIEYDVPFNEPYVYTLYWLKDGMYKVHAVELETNCDVWDSIYVPLDRYEVEVTGDPTANKFCEKNFNGTITATATSTNPDFKPIFRLVGVNIDFITEYQSSKVFTGLQDGTYRIEVLDTVTMCVYTTEEDIVVPFEENDITISPEVTPNHSCLPEYYDGSITATASTTTFENPVFYWKLSTETEYTANNHWTGLGEGYYRVYVIDTVSGCTADSLVYVGNEDVCAPRITITPENNNFYDNEVGFCKGQEDVARLCATATVDSVCAQGPISYKWFIDCHHDTIPGNCVVVNTQEEMCCYYEVEATSLVTGCKSTKRIRVCVTAPPAPQYTENGKRVINKLFSECENIDVDVCVDERHNWISAIWSGSWYQTPDEDKPYDTCFTIPANSKTPGLMYTYCVDLIDTNGCKVRDFVNFIPLPVVRNTVSIEKCEFAEVDQELFYHDTTIIRTYNGSNGCDSIVTYNIHVIPLPEVDFTAAEILIDSMYCEGVTLGAIYDSVVAHVKYAATKLQIKKDVNVWADFNKATPLTYEYKDSTFRFFVWSICDTSILEFQMDLNKAPRIDSFEVESSYCASTNNMICFKASTFNGASTTTAKLFLKDNPTHVLKTMNIYGEYDHEIFCPDPIFMPYAYNGKTLVLALINECDSVAAEQTLVIDTAFIHINDFEICENDTLNFSTILGNQSTDRFTSITAMIMPVIEQTGVDNYTYADPYPYIPGSELGYNLDHAKIYFVGTTEKCGAVNSDTAIITVNPNPQVYADFAIHAICVDEAVDFISTYSEIYFADDTTWMYAPIVSSNGIDDFEDLLNLDRKAVGSVAELVDSVKKIPAAVIFVKVSNDCDTITVPVMIVRILHKLDVVASGITVCPNETLEDVLGRLNAHIVDYGNYSHDDVEIRFFGGTNYQTEIYDYTKLSTVIANGGYIRVIAAVDPESWLPDCGQDTAYAQVTVLTNDTVQPTLQPGCECTALSYFIKTAPRWTGTVSIIDSFWTVISYSNLGVEPHRITVDSIMCAEFEPAVFYTWITSCHDTITTDQMFLDFLYEPQVTVKDTVKYCLGEPFNIADFNLYVYNPNGDDVAMDTTLTFGGTVIAMNYNTPLTAEDNGKLFIAAIHNDCNTVYDTTVVIVNLPPTPKAEGDTTICLEGNFDLTVVGHNEGSMYYWYVEGVENPIAITTDTLIHVRIDTLTSDNAHSFIIVNGGSPITVDRSEFYYFTVVEQDVNGCMSVSMENVSKDAFASDVLTVKSTDMFQFKFFDANGNETHHITGIETGNDTYYDWMIFNNCPRTDTLVFVEFTVYKDGVLIPADSIGEYFATRTGTQYSSTKQWINSNTLSWRTTMLIPGTTEHYLRSVTMYYNSSVPGNHTAEDLLSGNHFPNTNLNGQGAADAYESLYTHFLNNNRINARLVPFRQAGEYTIVYRLLSTSNPQIIQNRYWNAECNCNLIIGAQGAFAGQHTIIDTLITDSLKFSVTGPNLAPAAEPEVTPEIAPELNVVDNVVAPDMEVWPNPAPATTTTLKARVHNMAGNAQVTLTSLTGKQVYTGTTYIDNENYYFEFDINSVSVGSYILTVRTDEAIITKKVIITTLAK